MLLLLSVGLKQQNRFDMVWSQCLALAMGQATVTKCHPSGLIAAPRGNRQGHQFIIHHLGRWRLRIATHRPPPNPFIDPWWSNGNQTTSAILVPHSATSYPEVVIRERRQSQVICQFSEHRQRTDLTHISRVGLCWSQPHLVNKVSVWSPCLLKLVWKWPMQLAHSKQENIGKLVEHPETLPTSTIWLQTLQTLPPKSCISAVEPLCQGALSYATNSSKWIKCVATFLDGHAGLCHEAGP